MNKITTLMEAITFEDRKPKPGEPACYNCRFWHRPITEVTEESDGYCRCRAPQPSRSLDLFLSEALAHLAAHVINPEALTSTEIDPTGSISYGLVGANWEGTRNLKNTFRVDRL